MTETGAFRLVLCPNANSSFGEELCVIWKTHSHSSPVQRVLGSVQGRFQMPMERRELSGSSALCLASFHGAVAEIHPRS